MTKKELKFKSQICTTIEQSKRLLELGLKPETADMHHFKQSGEFSAHLGFFIDTYKNIPNWYQPAWSLHRLIALCPETIEEICNDGEAHCSLHIDFDKHRNIYNNIIDYIDWLIKKRYFNKEYLK